MIAMHNIVFFDVRDFEIETLNNFCKKGKYDGQFIAASLDDKLELTEAMKQAEVISFFTFSRVTEDVLKQFPNLKLIALRCVGFNNVDIDYCKKHNIQVLNSFGYGNVTVAEFAFGLILDVTRKISRAYMNLKNEHLESDTYAGYELGGKHLGIIGTGAIGSQVARIAHGFGMKILAYDIYPKQELIEKYEVKYLPLDELLKEADIISLHAPLTDKNFHMLDEEKFKLMKPNAVIINTARGELIDTKALYEALSKNQIFAAGLDVLEAENVLTKPEHVWDFDYLKGDTIKQTLINERLLRLHNVVITPHIAYNTKEAENRILCITFENIKNFFEGKIQNSVIM